MDAVMGIIIMLVGGLISLLPIIGIVILVVMLLKKNNTNPQDAKKPQQPIFSFKNLLKVYLYSIVSLSILIGLIGFTFVGKALLGMADSNFSYGLATAYEDYTEKTYDYYVPTIQPTPTTSNNYSCYDTKTSLVKIGDKFYCQNTSENKMDLINGITIIISTTIILVMHLVLLYKFEKDSPSNNIRKFFIFCNLMVYSLTAIITLPIAIYQTFNYILIAEKPVDVYSAPGGIVAFVIFTMIVWIAWLIIMMKNRDQKQAE